MYPKMHTAAMCNFKKPDSHSHCIASEKSIKNIISLIVCRNITILILMHHRPSAVICLVFDACSWFWWALNCCELINVSGVDNHQFNYTSCLQNSRSITCVVSTKFDLFQFSASRESISWASIVESRDINCHFVLLKPLVNFYIIIIWYTCWNLIP